jgi:hypothetical protein
MMHVGGLNVAVSPVATVAALGALVSLGTLTMALSTERGKAARSVSATAAILAVPVISIAVMVLSAPDPT